MADDFARGALAGKTVSEQNPFNAIMGKFQEAQARRYKEDQQRKSEEAELSKALQVLGFKHNYDKELTRISEEEKRKTGLLEQQSKGVAIEVPEEEEGSFEGTPFGATGKRFKAKSTGMNTAQLLSDTGEPPAGYEIVGYDQKGQPMIRKIKLSSAQEKRKVEVEELRGQIDNLTGLFSQAREEMEGVSGAGQRGVEGRLAGIFGIAKGRAGYSPAVNVYNDKRKAFATTVAKAAGEVRPTDQDIVRFLETLPDLKKNDDENAIIINQLKKDLESKDAGIVWKERTNSEQKENKQKPSGAVFYSKSQNKYYDAQGNEVK